MSKCKRRPNPAADKKGFSLVEILVSIVLLALLASFVAVFMLYWQNIRAQSNMLTEALNIAQREIEKKYDIYSTLINNNQTDDLDPNEISEIDCVVFGRDLKLYILQETFYMKDLAKKYFDNLPNAEAIENEYITLTRGIAYTYVQKPAVPQIDLVKINANGNDVDVVYFAEESSYAAVSMPIIMSENTNFHKYLFQWYESYERFHVLPLKGETMVGEGSVVPNSPYDFNYINGKSEMNLSDLSLYKGKIISCLVTPGSVHGYMGNSVSSNYIYVSALPRLTTGSYYALYDASLISYIDGYSISPNPDVFRIKVNSLNSELDYSGVNIALSHNAGSSIYLNTMGQSTGEVYGDNADVRFTRFLEYQTGTSSTIKEYNFGNANVNIYAFAVSNPVTDEQNINKAYLNRISGTTKTPMLYNIVNAGNNNEGWQIQYTSNPVTVRNRTSFQLGGTDVNIAELILVANPSQNEINSILKYLSDKYRILFY